MPASSRKPASVGRIVHVYSPRWVGPRPGQVVMAHGEIAGVQRVNVNVAVDGTNDREVLWELRDRAAGNTLLSLRIYGALNDTDRDQARAENASEEFGAWCEWPPLDGGAPSAPAPAPGTETRATV